MQSISSRDEFTLTIGGAHPASWSSFGSLEIDEANNLIEDTVVTAEENCKFELKIIKKQVVDELSVYFIDKFDDYFLNKDGLDLLSLINDRFTGKLGFEVFSECIYFSSSSIYFYPQGYEGVRTSGLNESERSARKKNYDENCSSGDLIANSRNLIPDDFYSMEKFPLPGISAFFHNACSVLSIAFLANYAKIRESLSVDFKIVGYKSISQENVPVDFWSTSTPYLYRIYNWAYSGGSASDKLGLIRNIVSIHAKQDEKIEINQILWEAINSNYQIYLKGNIEAYLDVKSKISDAVQESVDKATSIVDDYLNSVKNSLFGVVTFLITVVLVNGLKDNGFEVIFNNIYFYIVVVISILSVCYLLFIEYDSKERYHRASKLLLDRIEKTYGDILVEQEVEPFKKIISVDNKNYLFNKLKDYRTFWICIFSIFVIAFLIGNIAFSTSPVVNAFDPRALLTTKNGL